MMDLKCDLCLKTYKKVGPYPYNNHMYQDQDGSGLTERKRNMKNIGLYCGFKTMYQYSLNRHVCGNKKYYGDGAMKANLLKCVDSLTLSQFEEIMDIIKRNTTFLDKAPDEISESDDETSCESYVYVSKAKRLEKLSPPRS